jgi:NAD(P)-dependent dehydrogenase (short-subunit alcohol dehydrogenase family)
MKRYLITGASRGIGRAIAENLAGVDVELLLHGRDTVALAEVHEAVKPHCAHVVRLIHDLALPSGVSDLIDHVGKKPLNLLVNNAGIAIVKPFCEITPVEWGQTVGVNITAPFMLMQHFSPHMPPGSSKMLIGEGRPITLALFPHAEHWMTEYEVAPDGQRVSTRYAPGYFAMMRDFARTGELSSTYGSSMIVGPLGIPHEVQRSRGISPY